MSIKRKFKRSIRKLTYFLKLPFVYLFIAYLLLFMVFIIHVSENRSISFSDSFSDEFLMSQSVVKQEGETEPFHN